MRSGRGGRRLLVVVILRPLAAKKASAGIVTANIGKIGGIGNSPTLGAEDGGSD
jgi:hypothetical protein